MNAPVANGDSGAGGCSTDSPSSSSPSPPFPALEEKESRLRRLLEEKPRSARAMADLSTVLAEKRSLLLARHRRHHHSSGSDEVLGNCSEEEAGRGPGSLVAQLVREEAMMMAEQSIQVAPNKPFGYTAMSIVHADYSKRMGALDRAIEVCNANINVNDNLLVPRVLLMVRRLVEPRKEESRRMTARRDGGDVVGSASKKHPKRRPLNDNEESLYRQISAHLTATWETALLKKEKSFEEKGGQQQQAAEAAILQLALRGDYELGKFFRKMLPEEECRTRCRRHFRRAYDNLPQSDPHKSLAQFWLATIRSSTDGGSGGGGVDVDNNPSSNVGGISQCPKEYVISLYSTFAERFDKLLVEKLDYRAPTLLRQLVSESNDTGSNDSGLSKGNFRNALDLGCGSGLCGIAFRECIRDQLWGIDLSPEMIARARDRPGKCYDRLVVGDVATCLSQLGEGEGDRPSPVPAFDLVFSCDVFVYIGDLSPIFGHVRDRLSSGGTFAFSTELLDEGAASAPYQIQASARFAHKASYVQSLADEFSFELVAKKISSIRKNEGKDVVGLLVVLKKETTGC